MDSENSVFDRMTTDDPIVGAGIYNLVIGLTLIWGFAVNYWMVTNIDPEAIASVNPWIFFIGYFAPPFSKKFPAHSRLLYCSLSSSN